MKKSMVLSAILFVLALATQAQTDITSVSSNEQSIMFFKHKKDITTDKKLPRTPVKFEGSYQTREAFYRDFGNIPVSQWRESHNLEEATFTNKEGQVLTAFYDFDSKLIGTISGKSFSDLPQKAQDYIQKKYPDYAVKEVIMFDDNEFNETDMMLYNRQFEDADNYFVELDKGDKKIVVQSNMNGDVFYFTSIK